MELLVQRHAYLLFASWRSRLDSIITTSTPLSFGKEVRHAVDLYHEWAEANFLDPAPLHAFDDRVVFEAGVGC